MTENIDTKFKDVKNQKWLPFIGDNYLKVPNDKKLLIVGESHYHDNSEESIKKHESPDFTRIVVKELAIGECPGTTKIFSNFHRAMFANGEFDSEIFWNLTSFYNFIQRPMETNKGRPKNADFYDGWLIFFETVKIIKPKTCLFIGVGALKMLNKALEKSDFELECFKKDDKISRTFPRRATIKNKDNQIDLIFIQHTSQYFSWSKWNEYIKLKLASQLKWFEEKFKKS